MVSTKDLLAAAEAVERAATATSPQEQWRADIEMMAHQETIKLGLINAAMDRFSSTPHAEEVLPLRADGDDFGRVRNRIPARLFFHLLQQRNFGWEGLTSEEGQRDLEKKWPVVKLKTVSGRCTVGFRTPCVTFGRGTLNLAT